MIFVWIFLYGGAYVLGEYLSERVGQTHCVTAFAVLLFAVAFAVYSQRKSRRKLCPPYTLQTTSKSLLALTPLLCFPLGNLLTVRGEGNAYSYLLLLSVAIVEELFFRGYLLGYFRERTRTGALVSSAVFALCHLVNIGKATLAFVAMQTASAFAVGLCFCALTLRYKSLLLPTLLHIAINLTGAGSVAHQAWWYASVTACSLLYLFYAVFIISSGERK